MSLLAIRNLNKSFGGLHAINKVSFDVPEGTIKAVIGPNGAGKTTLFNLIAGSLAADSGEIMFRNKSIFNIPAFRIAGRGISRTFQNIKLFERMTVLENVMTGMHVRTGAGFLSSMLRLPQAGREESRIRKKAAEMLDFFGLSDCADAEALSLPFGRQRAVEFARALVSEPQLLLLDEPAAGLNMHETAGLATQIKKIQKQGTTVLIVEHDMSLVMSIAERVVVLSYGQKITEGKPEDVQRNREVIRVYLGDGDA